MVLKCFSRVVIRVNCFAIMHTLQVSLAAGEKCFIIGLPGICLCFPSPYTLWSAWILVEAAIPTTRIIKKSASLEEVPRWSLCRVQAFLQLPISVSLGPTWSSSGTDGWNFGEAVWLFCHQPHHAAQERVWDVHLGLVSQHKFGEWFWVGANQAVKMGSSERSLPWYMGIEGCKRYALAKTCMWRGCSSLWLCFKDCFTID